MLDRTLRLCYAAHCHDLVQYGVAQAGPACGIQALEVERLRVSGQVDSLWRQAEAIYHSLNTLALEPGWPASTARQAVGLWQEMYDVVQQALNAVAGYLRAVPRPATAAASSRWLQCPTSITCIMRVCKATGCPAICYLALHRAQTAAVPFMGNQSFMSRTDTRPPILAGSKQPG